MTVLVSAEEMAKIIGVSAKSVRRMANEGKIPYHKFGRFLRFDVVQVLADTRAPARTARWYDVHR